MDRETMKPPGHAKGERVNTAKLTAAQVTEIRTRYAAGGVTLKQLAVDYGVNRDTIGKIVRRETWTHLPDDPEA